MVIFWDFDGVIKDSVEVKSLAFGQLFAPFGDDVVKRVREHHEANGGLSRFDKLPIYLRWAGCVSTTELIEEFSKKFSILVKRKVIESDWVPGALEFVRNKKNKQLYFIITATPQDEIEDIINELELTKFFHKIIGAPISKSNAIKSILESYCIDAEQSFMFGDSMSDYQAATENGITFLLRRTTENEDLQKRLNCIMFNDFTDDIWGYLDKK